MNFGENNVKSTRLEELDIPQNLDFVKQMDYP